LPERAGFVEEMLKKRKIILGAQMPGIRNRFRVELNEPSGRGRDEMK
jgi:hypothetical protein